MELFVGQGWADYLAEMIKEGTYGDHLTLQAASNIFNAQITVHSSLGLEANTIISPFTGAGVANFNLEHFAEGQGEHYVCLEVEESATENCLNEIQENQEVWNEEENEKGKEGESNDKRENKMNGWTNREDQAAKEGACDGIYENQNDSDNQQSRSKEKCSFEYLPDELITMIFETALRSCSNSNASDACILHERLRNVCSRFRQCVDTFTDLLPKIYCRNGPPGEISVRRLIKEFGPSSGLILELNRWHHAWLELYAIGLGWFRINNIYGATDNMLFPSLCSFLPHQRVFGWCYTFLLLLLLYLSIVLLLLSGFLAG